MSAGKTCSPCAATTHQKPTPKKLFQLLAPPAFQVFQAITSGNNWSQTPKRSTQLQWVKVTSSTQPPRPPKMFLNRIISVGCRLPVALTRALSRNLITSKIVSPSSFLLRDTPLQKTENFGNCCSTFPHYVFTKASSNRLSEWVQNHSDNT